MSLRPQLAGRITAGYRPVAAGATTLALRITSPPTAMSTKRYPVVAGAAARTGLALPASSTPIRNANRIVNRLERRGAMRTPRENGRKRRHGRRFSLAPKGSCGGSSGGSVAAA
jgi:hypothetical protein